MHRTVALFSLGGAPGVTCAAMALAAVWPGGAGAVLVEADASGGDVATWRRLQPAPGLTGLAAAARHGGASADLAAHTQTLPGGLAVCHAPVTADRAEGAVRLVAQNPGVLASADGAAVVLDLGRLTPGAPASALAARADEALLLVSDSLAQLRRAKEASEALVRSLPSLRTVVVGGSGSVREIEGALGPGVWGRLPADERSAAFLRGETNPRKPHHRPLLKAAARLAGDLADGADRAPAPVPGTPPPAPEPTGVHT
ncbi:MULTISPECIES: P-loop NTPase family protein [Nocardiopsis]|uniref:Chromosome partitioning protein n=1 Tax=Nocardiopsis sinuspersici TaxID=501010 RepID=A0A1V3BXI5_9ACTN|nr:MULTISPECIES: hypothetical protein [Nocardiopsis]OOC53271.1 hypothetical protein NOSIN_05100 [Nocardiopsis sinuspersici]